VYWVHNVAFREDKSRVCLGHVAENLAVLHHHALNPLRQVRTAYIGIKANRLRADGDEAYLRRALAG
jgi:hypothetical protein